MCGDFLGVFTSASVELEICIFNFTCFFFLVFFCRRNFVFSLTFILRSKKCKLWVDKKLPSGVVYLFGFLFTFCYATFYFVLFGCFFWPLVGSFFYSSLPQIVIVLTTLLWPQITIYFNTFFFPSINEMISGFQLAQLVKFSMVE